MQEKKYVSWKVIIVCLIVFWPIGIYLLVRKIGSNKNEALKNSKTLTIVGACFVAFAVLYFCLYLSGDLKPAEPGETVDLGSVLVGEVFFAGGGAAMLVIARRMKINAVKLKKYIAIIVNQEETYIPHIVSAMQLSEEIVKKDLQEMIDKGYFNNAYLDLGANEIVLAKTRLEQQEEKAQGFHSVEEQPKTRVVICKNCGARNRVRDQESAVCEYCDSPLGN